MIFNDSPLALIVDKVRKNKDPRAFAHYGLLLHTPDGVIDIYRLMNVTVDMNFVQDYCAQIKASFMVGEGTYRYKILANNHQLEASFYRRSYDPFDPGAVIEDAIVQQKYTCLVLNTEGDEIEQTGVNPTALGTQDLSATVTVTVQLFLNVIEQFRMRSCGGIYRRSTVGDVIKTILMGESSQVDVLADYKPQGVDMVEPLDAVVREHIEIPHRMPSSDAPAYIHKHCGGVYSAGLSYFYHNDMWFVYPTYDYTRFQEAKQQLTLVIVPEKAMPFQEYTFMQNAGALTVLVTGKVSTTDFEDKLQLQDGNGIRFTDPEKLTDTLEVKNNKAIYQRGLTTSEFTAVQRRNGLNNVVASENFITSNKLYEYSKLANRQGKMAQLTWQNSNHELLIPGMQLKVLYMYGDLVKEAYGVLLGVQTNIQYTGKGITSGNYTSVSVLLVLLGTQ